MASSNLVICTGFEPVTSCLSSKRSKPTELTDRLSEIGGKNTLFSDTANTFEKFFFSVFFRVTDTCLYRSRSVSSASRFCS